MAFRLLLSVSLVALSHVCLVNSVEPSSRSPWVIPSSNQWDGIDGPWSSFAIGIGSRLQILRCLSGFSLDVVVLPVESPSCNENSSNSCAYRSTFHRSLSSTWKVADNDTAWDRAIKKNLNKTTNRSTVSGTDYIFLSAPYSFYHVLPTIETSSLGFFVGILGLSTGSRDGGRSQSLLAQLATATIPSVSFSYTAGSIRKKTKGSLILGGYDTSRIKTGTTIERPRPAHNVSHYDAIHINIEAIFVNSTWSASWVLPASEAARFVIDPALPHIWLPLEACAMFEKAFNLTWNADLGLYLIDDTTHAQMQQENPTISFLLGSQFGVPSKMITLSYASFDLQLSPPLVEKNTSYFPIRRAMDPRQYLLGRAFLQETYLTVDYEHATFNLSVAEEYPVQDGAILPIISKDPWSEYGTPMNARSRLSSGAYAGIGIGVAAFVLLLAGFMFLCWRKHLRMVNKTDSMQSAFNGAELQAENKELPVSVVHGHVELPDKGVVEVMGREPKELETNEPNHEVNTVHSPIEMNNVLPRRSRNSW